MLKLPGSASLVNGLTGCRTAGQEEGRARGGAAAGRLGDSNETRGSREEDHLRLPRCLPSDLTTQGSGVRGRRASLALAKTWAAPHPLQPIVRPRQPRASGCEA